MALEKLLNKPFSEPELLNELVDEIQSHFSNYQNECYFLKLGKVEERISQIVWTKSFPDLEQIMDFYYDSKFKRACIMIKFEKGRYVIYCGGFHWCNRFEVWMDHESAGRPFEYLSDRDNKPMPPRELIEEGFRDLCGTFLKLKKSEAV